LNDPKDSVRSIAHFELEETLRQEGCAVCRLVDQVGRSYLENLRYELVNDSDVQKEFRASLGLCNPHAHRMLAIGNGLGIAILYQATIRELLNLLSKVPEPLRPQTPLAVLLGYPSRAKPAVPEAGVGCMVCCTEDKAEERYLNVLLDGTENASLHGLLEGPEAVCVRHLSRASVLAGGWLPPALIEVTREALRDLNADLGQYVRHNDYRFRDEAWGRARDSPRRVVSLLVGRRQR
jgi:hypothetical protein